MPTADLVSLTLRLEDFECCRFLPRCFDPLFDLAAHDRPAETLMAEFSIYELTHSQRFWKLTPDALISGENGSARLPP